MEIDALTEPQQCARIRAGAEMDQAICRHGYKRKGDGQLPRAGMPEDHPAGSVSGAKGGTNDANRMSAESGLVRPLREMR